MLRQRSNASEGRVAQGLEQLTHNQLVGGSNPSAPTTFFLATGSITYEETAKLALDGERSGGSIMQRIKRLPCKHFTPTETCAAQANGLGSPLSKNQ